MTLLDRPSLGHGDGHREQVQRGNHTWKEVRHGECASKQEHNQRLQFMCEFPLKVMAMGIVNSHLRWKARETELSNAVVWSDEHGLV